jgi:phosphohistidine phosphatase
MKTLFLLRHAKSSWSEENLADFDRPLNKRGLRAALAVGRHLTQQEAAPAQILCSPARRTRETLEQLHRAFGPAAAIPTRFEKEIYMGEAPLLLRRLRRLNDSLASVMIIGHNPGMESLAAILLAAGPGPGRGADDEAARRRMAEKFPTAALATLTADIERWADLRPGGAALASFVRPKDLPAH